MKRNAPNASRTPEDRAAPDEALAMDGRVLVLTPRADDAAVVRQALAQRDVRE